MLQKFVHIVMENAGADRIVLLLQQCMYALVGLKGAWPIDLFTTASNFFLYS